MATKIKRNINIAGTNQYYVQKCALHKDFAVLFDNMDRLKYWSRRITEKCIVNVNNNNNFSWNITIDALCAHHNSLTGRYP